MAPAAPPHFVQKLDCALTHINVSFLLCPAFCFIIGEDLGSCEYQRVMEKVGEMKLADEKEKAVGRSALKKTVGALVAEMKKNIPPKKDFTDDDDVLFKKKNKKM